MDTGAKRSKLGMCETELVPTGLNLEVFTMLPPPGDSLSRAVNPISVIKHKIDSNFNMALMQTENMSSLVQTDSIIPANSASKSNNA